MFSASSLLSSCQNRNVTLLGLKKRFETSYSMGQQLLDKLVYTTKGLLEDCRRDMLAASGDRDKHDYRHCLLDRGHSGLLQDILHRYQQLGHFLRYLYEFYLKSYTHIRTYECMYLILL